MSETKSMSTFDHVSPEAPKERLELGESEVNARFADIVRAEEALAATDHEERERREAASNYKPNQGFDINSMKPAGAV